MNNGVVMERECPECGEWIEFSDHRVHVHCPECQTEYMVDPDAEFVNGHWRDLTKLIPVVPVLAEPSSDTISRHNGEAREEHHGIEPVKSNVPDSRGDGNTLL